MATVTTHTTGRVVVHESDDQSIEVVQLPARDAAAQAAARSDLVEGEVASDAPAEEAAKPTAGKRIKGKGAKPRKPKR